eukprot:278891-Prorocentrum_minimum.AAC.4
MGGKNDARRGLQNLRFCEWECRKMASKEWCFALIQFEVATDQMLQGKKLGGWGTNSLQLWQQSSGLVLKFALPHTTAYPSANGKSGTVDAKHRSYKESEQIERVALGIAKMA